MSVAVPRASSSAAWSRWLLLAWPWMLALAVLGPALAPGYVLTHDMVWVPDLSLGPAALGLGTALPRAVPSDAVVAVLDEVVPAMLLQKLVLLGPLVAGAYGVARLVGAAPWARAVAMTVWIWNPFVVERLVMGHWPVLVGYAALPWVLLLAARWGRGAPAPALLPVVVLGSLSASAGIATAVALAAGLLSPPRGGPGPAPTARPPRPRLALRGLGLLLAANAPWLVTGPLHAGSVVETGDGFSVFAPAAEGDQPPLVAALSLGGLWNTDATPLSRTDARGWLYLGVLVVLVAVGAWAVRSRRADVPALPALAVCWVGGYALVLVTATVPGLLDDVAGTVPGLALFRDGTRLLGLCAPLLAVLAGIGAQAVAGHLGRRAPRAWPVVAAGGLWLVLWPLVLLPDAAGGAAGRVHAVDYPARYLALPGRVERAARPGARLVLPLSTYRAPGWNDGVPVLDPVPRLVGGDVVAGGGLLVSGRLLLGEDPRERVAVRALGAPTASARRAALGRAGFGVVVVDGSAGAAPAVTQVGPGLRQVAVVPLRADVVRRAPWSWQVLAALAWLAFGVVLVGGSLASVVRRGAGAERRIRGSLRVDRG